MIWFGLGISENKSLQQHTLLGSHPGAVVLQVEEFVLGFSFQPGRQTPHGDEGALCGSSDEVGGKRTTALGCLWWSDDEGKESRVCTLVLINLIH